MKMHTFQSSRKKFHFSSEGELQIAIRSWQSCRGSQPKLEIPEPITSLPTTWYYNQQEKPFKPVCLSLINRFSLVGAYIRKAFSGLPDGPGPNI